MYVLTPSIKETVTPQPGVVSRPRNLYAAAQYARNRYDSPGWTVSSHVRLPHCRAGFSSQGVGFFGCRGPSSPADGAEFSGWWGRVLRGPSSLWGRVLRGRVLRGADFSGYRFREVAAPPNFLRKTIPSQLTFDCHVIKIPQMHISHTRLWYQQ